MRRTLAAFCIFLGLTACGGTVDSTEAESSQELKQAFGPPQLLPYCWNLDQTSCSPVGATQRCTDGIWTDYVCTCKRYTSGTSQYQIWDCPTVR
jgi:hypothetical protein